MRLLHAYRHVVSNGIAIDRFQRIKESGSLSFSQDSVCTNPALDVEQFFIKTSVFDMKSQGS